MAARAGSADRRARLLETGVRLASERPYDDFSLEEVAATAGVSRTELHRHFPGRRYLYIEALRTTLARLLLLLEPEPGLPPGEGLRRALEAYLASVQEHAAAYRAVLRGEVGADPEVAAVVDDVRLTIAQRILGGLGSGAGRPHVQLAVVGWVGLVEAASLDWLDRTDLPRSEVAAALAAALPALLSATAA